MEGLLGGTAPAGRLTVPGSLAAPAIGGAEHFSLQVAGRGRLQLSNRRAGAGLAICVAVLVSLLQIGAHTRAASVGLVVNIVIVVLIIMNWRHLQPAGTPYLPSP